MSKKQIKKLEDIQLKIASLQTEQTKIEQSFAKELVELLKEANAFYADFYVLVGGLLEVIQKAKITNENQEDWRQAGRKFRQRFKKLHKRQEAVRDAA